MIDRIDLRSDTVTKPTLEMRQAMFDAEVGDEQFGEDPTANRLVKRISDLLGKDDAVFVPSATMANEIAFAVHSRSGGELIGHRLSHPFLHEGGAPAYLARLMLRPVDGLRGMFSPYSIGEVISPPYDPPNSAILLVEHPTNLGGGAIWGIEGIESVTSAAREHHFACHMDGARLMNAVVASGIPASDYASHFDSITLCFSKGLGAPFGAALAGSKEFVAEARRYKKIFGGAMRQSGIVAAAALYALDHHVERLAEDHDNAKRLAKGIVSLPGIELDPRDVETNIIAFGVDSQKMTSGELVARMSNAGVDFFTIGPQRCRLVTHLGITPDMIDEAIRRFASVMK